MRVYVTVMSPGSATTPLTDAAQGDFASYASALVRGVPSIEHVVVGNEPNLNRFWLPQFALDGTSASPAAYLALLARTYDALKAVSPDVRVYGGALSPRGSDRPGGVRPTHSPTKFVDGARHRLSRQRTRSARHGRVRHPPVRRQLEPVAVHRAPEHHDDRNRRLRQARDASRRGVRRHGAGRLEAADLLRRVRRRVGHPLGEGVALHRRRACRDAPRQRGDAGGFLRAGARARVLPADGRRRAVLPLARRARAPRLAVGDPLHGRDAEDEQAARDGVARPHDRRLDRALPRRRASRARRPISGSARARPRSAASSARASAATSTVATGCVSRTP